jgi:hypothetical protein
MKMKIINVTPHPIRFQNRAGEVHYVYEVPPCGILINARPVEEPAGTHPSGAELVRTRFVADPASEEALTKLERENPGAVTPSSSAALLLPRHFRGGCWPWFQHLDLRGFRPLRSGCGTTSSPHSSISGPPGAYPGKIKKLIFYIKQKGRNEEE